MKAMYLLLIFLRSPSLLSRSSLITPRFDADSPAMTGFVSRIEISSNALSI